MIVRSLLIVATPYQWAMSHIPMSHVSHTNESCLTYQWVTSHIWALSCKPQEVSYRVCVRLLADRVMQTTLFMTTQSDTPLHDYLLTHMSLSMATHTPRCISAWPHSHTYVALQGHPDTQRPLCMTTQSHVCLMTTNSHTCRSPRLPRHTDASRYD